MLNLCEEKKEKKLMNEFRITVTIGINLKMIPQTNLIKERSEKNVRIESELVLLI